MQKEALTGRATNREIQKRSYRSRGLRSVELQKERTMFSGTTEGGDYVQWGYRRRGLCSVGIQK